MWLERLRGWTRNCWRYRLQSIGETECCGDPCLSIAKNRGPTPTLVQFARTPIPEVRVQPSDEIRRYRLQKKPSMKCSLLASLLKNTNPFVLSSLFKQPETTAFFWYATRLFVANRRNVSTFCLHVEGGRLLFALLFKFHIKSGLWIVCSVFSCSC